MCKSNTMIFVVANGSIISGSLSRLIGALSVVSIPLEYSL